MTSSPPSLAPDTLGPTLCIGEILAEIVAIAPGDGFMTAQPLHGPYPSGAPAIFADQVGRMGGSAAMVGTVGDDDFGLLNTARLRADGVDVTAIVTHPTLPTGTAFVRYRGDGGRSFVFNMWTSAAGAVGWAPEVEAIVARAGHLHVMGTLLVQDGIWQIIERAAGAIKARGGSVSLDPNLRPELRMDVATTGRLGRMIDFCDLLLPSGDELFAAAGLSPEVGEPAALAALFDRGIGEIVIKRGANGATCARPDGTVDAPGFTVDELDPTGAGDCFGGAYLACRRLGMPIPRALDYATAAGARNVTFRGPMEGAGTRAELDHFIATTKRRRPCP